MTTAPFWPESDTHLIWIRCTPKYIKCRPHLYISWPSCAGDFQKMWPLRLLLSVHSKLPLWVTNIERSLRYYPLTAGQDLQGLWVLPPLAVFSICLRCETGAGLQRQPNQGQILYEPGNLCFHFLWIFKGSRFHLTVIENQMSPSLELFCFGCTVGLCEEFVVTSWFVWEGIDDQDHSLEWWRREEMSIARANPSPSPRLLTISP